MCSLTLPNSVGKWWSRKVSCYIFFSGLPQVLLDCTLNTCLHCVEAASLTHRTSPPANVHPQCSKETAAEYPQASSKIPTGARFPAPVRDPAQVKDRTVPAPATATTTRSRSSRRQTLTSSASVRRTRGCSSASCNLPAETDYCSSSWPRVMVMSGGSAFVGTNCERKLCDEGGCISSRTFWLETGARKLG